MKFTFKLEAVLKSRKIDKDLAERDFWEADRALATQLQYIKSLYEEMDNTRLRIATTQEEGGTQSAMLQSLEEFIEGQKIRILKERENARALMQVKEQKHDVLVEKSKEFKIIEKLKEKKRAEFRTAKLKKETNELDDITIMRYRRESKYE